MPADPIRWETVPCPACGSAGDREFLRVGGDDGAEYRLGQCGGCRLVYTNPRPDAASIGRFYPPDYAPYQPPARRRRGFLRALRGRLGLRREKTLAGRMPVPPDGVLVDYGCGSGWFAAQMRARGWRAVGMDFSGHAAAAARKNFGLDVIHGTLPHPLVAPGSVDAVTLRAVLEHVHDPRELLAAVYDALRPGGWVYVSVPNLSSWGFRAFGRAWFALDPPRHLLHFTPATLRRVAEGCGLAVEAMTTIGHAKWTGLSAARAAGQSWRNGLFRSHLARSAATRWATWTGRGDDVALLARKPAAAAAAVTRRAA